MLGVRLIKLDYSTMTTISKTIALFKEQVDAHFPYLKACGEKVWYNYSYETHKWIKISTEDAEKLMFQQNILDFAKAKGVTMTSGIRKELIHEITEYAFDGNFPKELDRNFALIGFTNGVYDLNQNKFRSGVPEDRISMCTGYPYLEQLSGNIGADIDDFLEKIQPDQEMRNYLMRSLGKLLSNGNNIKNYIWTGPQFNVMVELMQLLRATLGDYCNHHESASKTYRVNTSYCCIDEKVFSCPKNDPNVPTSIYLWPGAQPHIAPVYEQYRVIPFLQHDKNIRLDLSNVMKASFMSRLIYWHNCVIYDHRTCPNAIKDATRLSHGKNTDDETAKATLPVNEPKDIEQSPKKVVDYALPNLVDVRGGLSIKNDAEFAVLLFEETNPVANVKRVYMGCISDVFVLVDGKLSNRRFKNGIYIEVPTDIKEINKVRCHMLMNTNEKIMIHISSAFY